MNSTPETPEADETPRAVLTVRIFSDGVCSADSDGCDPRIGAHMLRHLADSFDLLADEEGLPELDGHDRCGQPQRVTDPAEVAEYRAERTARRAAAKLS
ncbi:hypothetical protein SEA_ALTADENA_39 [Arthrobacter phage Altadena]|uniref:Uncharacterized protein n=1 Tax=Arthrobacter phage Altadena TaxID=3059064 RepID=A0AA96KKM4_9CAUD|nr:hypothetical protein SEA_ALTADENA_39 [Arthrobacter phage Altadena]